MQMDECKKKRKKYTRAYVQTHRVTIIR